MAKDPVCGMKVDSTRAAATAEYQGETYYFCAPGCSTLFEKQPEKYLGRTQAGHEMAKDPVCGMEVDPAQAAATVEYRGETYYFCAPGCEALFKKQPPKHLQDPDGPRGPRPSLRPGISSSSGRGWSNGPTPASSRPGLSD